VRAEAGDGAAAAEAGPRPEEVMGALTERITQRLRHELQAELAEQTADACKVAERQVHHEQMTWRNRAPAWLACEPNEPLGRIQR
jgi:hypothetical protein